MAKKSDEPATIFGPKGFFDLERIGDATEKTFGMHRATAYSGTPDNPKSILGFFDFRTFSGMFRVIKKMRKMIGLDD